MFFSARNSIWVICFALLAAGCADKQLDQACDTSKEVKSAIKQLKSDHHNQLGRYLGEPSDENLITCRGGDPNHHTPWVSWASYFSTGDASSSFQGRKISPENIDSRTEMALANQIGDNLKTFKTSDFRGVTGSLVDLEVQRVELINLNLFDNYTYQSYIKGRGDTKGNNIKQWPEMRLEGEQLQANQGAIKISDKQQQSCLLPLLNHRTRDGICNDMLNPKMGSTGTLFNRNVSFDATYVDLTATETVKNRHGDRLSSLMSPNPQQISLELFTRPTSQGSDNCNQGYGVIAQPGKIPTYSAQADCDYAKAPFFNVLAAFWIQFMTHDWFSHLKEGHNKTGERMAVGCTPEIAAEKGCRPADTVEPALFADESKPGSFHHKDKVYLERSYKTTRNFNTAWWDASQIYGFDPISEARVIRDPQDKAKLLQKEISGTGLNGGYLPPIEDCEPSCQIKPQWKMQESAAFADNWSVGMSFYHNLFVREHNSFVDAFRAMQQQNPTGDSGVLDIANPSRTKTWSQVNDDELFEIARLVVAAEIAKIHTIEWTTQLLYNEPLYRGMNSNWYGLFEVTSQETDRKLLRRLFDRKESFTSILANKVGKLDTISKANEIYSILASGAGIFGLNNGMSYNEQGLMRPKRVWGAKDLDKFNQGINHFGAPFNFPEEFTSVYRLHPLLPDLVEFRGEIDKPNQITQMIPLVNTVRGDATNEIYRGIDQWALSMGRQRLGLLQLNNHPHFLQNLEMPHLGEGVKMDIVALDVIRDRERGVPKFNELRRQIGLKSLTSFDDFINVASTGEQRNKEQQIVTKLREIYGTHICDSSKVITQAQTNRAIANRPHYKKTYGDQRISELIDDCLGYPDGTEVDNIEDLDLVVGWLAETTRPHGYAISETQFHIFIINASRRLFSDRFFTSSFRPEFYSHLGVDWVNNNGPVNAEACPSPLLIGRLGKKLACLEPEKSNGHIAEVSPMKRVLMRNLPELIPELLPVVNAFDPWARDRGVYYSLDWTPRPGAESDPAFQ